MPLDCKRRWVHKPRKQLHFLERLTSFDSISRNFRAGIEDEDVKKSLFIYCQIKVGQRDGGRQGCCLCCGGVEVVFFFFFDWLPLLSAVCVKHGAEKQKKRKTKLTTRTSGWQHSANHNWVCAELQPMREERAREHCMLVGRLEEIGCVAVGGRGHESQQCQSKPDELPAA